MRLVWLAVAFGLLAGPAAASPTYALSLLGPPKLPADFTHFPSADPDAPKGGEVRLAAVGSFDSLNPFIVRGSAAGPAGGVFETLMVPDADEAQTVYCHLCQTVDVSDDKRTVTFVLRPEAKFSDGTPVLASDVAWSFDTLREKGRPLYRSYWAGVDTVEAKDARTVVFHLKDGDNRELPVILGEVPVLPQHWWAGRDFTAPLQDPPVGSGPYAVDRVSLGQTIVMRRRPDYWAANLPTAKGRYNFDTMRTDYFRDPTVAFEAFKAGQVDFRQENSSKTWSTAYDFPAVKDGLVKLETLPHRLPTGLQGFAMNTRRDVFKDVRVRQAMDEVFDFQWMNKNLFYGLYTRTESYFSNSEYASGGVPEGAELALLEPFRAQLPPALFTQPFALPVTDGSGNNREGLRRALALLEQAGWSVKDHKLVNAAGQQMRFEILLDQPAFERVALPYQQWLGRLGIDAQVRTVDAAQFQKRLDDLDFDMASAIVPQSESPGNEQVDMWSCAAANEKGTQNYAGVCTPVVDALVKAVLAATTHEALVPAVRALDRVLLWQWYFVPQWHLQAFWVAYWDRFGHPAVPVRTGLDFSAWWVDAKRAAATDAARAH